MQPTRTVVIHGWSDSSKSFRGIKKVLHERGLGAVEEIYLTDYQSREDSLTFFDIAEGLHDALVERGLVEADGSSAYQINMLVHSTGGLVVRHWLHCHYARDGKACPVKRIVMLAPANFGSPLARLGKSLLARGFRGRWTWQDAGETGQLILDALDMASPFQWQLAHDDVLTSGCLFHERGILVTIIVGARGYDQIFRRALSKPGTDGTVAIAGCNLNSVKFILDVTDDTAPVRWTAANGGVRTAFAVLPDHDHGTIVERARLRRGEPVDPALVALIERGLRVRGGRDFLRHATRCHTLTESTWAAPNEAARSAGRHQQFFFRVVDQFDQPVRDYFLEFYVKKSEARGGDLAGAAGAGRQSQLLSEQFQAVMTGNAYRNRADPSLRSFLVDYDALAALTAQARTAHDGHVQLCMRISVPEVDHGIRYNHAKLNALVLHDTAGNPATRPSFQFPDTTTLMEVRVRRVNDYVEVSST